MFLNFKFSLLQNNFIYWIAPLSKVGSYFLKCNLQTLLQTFWEHLFASKISPRSSKNVIASLSSDWRSRSPALLGSVRSWWKTHLGAIHGWLVAEWTMATARRAPGALGCSSLGRKHLSLAQPRACCDSWSPFTVILLFSSLGYFFLKPKSFVMRLDWDKGTDTDCFPGAARD